MIGIDSNVLVRFLTRDDEQQYEQAKRLLLLECTSDNPGFINTVVMAELVWVLRKTHRVSQDDIAAVVEHLLDIPQLLIDRGDSVKAALNLFRQSRADFTDCLIGLLNQKAGCKKSVTFDKAASKLEGFELLC